MPSVSGMETYLAAFHTVLSELDAIGLDADRVFVWANCEDTLYRRNRKQLIAALPVLACALADDGRSPTLDALAAMVDRGNPLIIGLAQLIQVRKQCIRFLIGKSPQMLGPQWMAFPLEVFLALDLFAQERLPRSAADWRIMRTFWEASGLGNNSSNCPNGVSIRKYAPLKVHFFIGLFGTCYQQRHESLCRVLQDNLARLSDVSDYFEFAKQWSWGLFPDATEHAAHWISNHLLTRYSATALIRQSDIWHQQIGHVRKLIATPGDHEPLASWPALPSLPSSNGGLSIVSLTTPEELRTESKKLGHCVECYTHRCIAGDSHIVSLRNEAGEILSTAEIRCDMDNPNRFSPRVIQHRGPKNRNPEPGCVAALDAWLEHWGSADFQREMQTIIEFHLDETRRTQVSALFLSEYDWPLATMSQMMRHVLPDYDASLAWLVERFSSPANRQAESVAKTFTQIGNRLRSK